MVIFFWIVGVALLIWAIANFESFKDPTKEQDSQRISHGGQAGPAKVRQQQSQSLAPIRSDPTGALMGDGSFSFEVVGESHYQDALRSIAGPEGDQGKRYQTAAIIQHEPTNRYDKHACAVLIRGKQVGYIPKDTAKELVAHQVANGKTLGFALTCNALIVDGWISRNGRSRGSYGVKLDYVPSELPPSAIQKEMLRFMGGKVSKALTRGEIDQVLEKLRTENPERFEQWKVLEQLIEHLQSADGREEFMIKKPSIKAVRDTFNQMIADGVDYKKLSEDMIEEFVELLTDNNPSLSSI